MTRRPIVAITGATGAVGGVVARRLAGEGRRLRLVVRDANRAPRLPGADVAQIPGYHDRDAVRDALRDVSVLFLVSGEEAKDRLEQHRTAVRAAADAGVERIVYTSFLGASPDATFTLARDHFHTEQAIEEAGLGLAALRNSLYQDVLPHFVTPDGTIRGPAGQGRFAPVARRDVADVAVACLLDERFHGRLDVTGPQLMDMADVASILSDVLDRRVSYVAETLDEAYDSRAHYGAPDWEVRGWVTSYAAIAAGELETVSDVVERVGGHPPTMFEAFLRTR